MKYVFISLLLCCLQVAFAQTPSPVKTSRLNFASTGSDPFGTRKAFIENIGQYDVLREAYKTDKVLFAYEGLEMPVLLTNTGLVHVERKLKSKKKRDEDEDEEEEDEREEEEKWTITEKAVSLKWTGAAENSEVKKEESLLHYFTYGSLPVAAKAFKKISYSNLYPGIDLHYSFEAADKAGFQFSFTVGEGADAARIRWQYSGDVKKLRTDAKGNLLVSSSIETAVLSAPKAFYADEPGHRVRIEFKLTGNAVQFYFPDGYDHNRKLVIDPFVSNTVNLTGLNARIAKDMDFDYNGNLYVSGGGNATLFQMVKYNAAGVLQWTFNGGPIVITGSPSWNFGLNYGGFVLDKPTGKIYLSQGWNTAGVKVVRLTTGGTYDNYVTQPNVSFSEGWRMFWDCSNSTGQMLIAGGGSSSNLDFGIFSPPSTVLTTQNITGLSSFSQDIADAVIDPRNHEMYTLFAHGHVSPNNLYKHGAPYKAADIKWTKGTGFPTLLGERVNRPYLATGSLDDNSVNSLALNASYLFYWDGKNLKAFSKSTGNAVGATFTSTTDTALRQGGIVADECGNVFVGTKRGLIKVYKFDGATFDDAAAPDLTVTGFTADNNSVYDLAYDDVGKILYACGRGFVASFDVTPYCIQATYSIQLTKNCTALSVTAQLSPAPPVGSTLNYVLYSGGTQISSNTTGVFTGLTLGTAYTIKTLVNEACSGVQTAVDFVFAGPQLSIAKTPACGSNGSLTVTASDGTAPYSYSLDGTTFQTSNAFSNLTVGTYTITVKDALGCVTIVPTSVEAGANCVTATATVTNEKCSLHNGSITVTAAAGTAPYAYSLDGLTFQTSNVFNNLAAGNYTVTVKDASGGTVTVPATVLSVSNGLMGLTFTTTPATCANNDGGGLAAAGTGGVTPYEYSINNGAYQPSGNFANLASANYTVTVRDVNGCSFSQPVVVPLNNDLTVDAGSNQTICEGDSILLNATSNGKNFTWSPALGLSNTNVLRPKASPVVNTTYYLTAKNGPCTAKDSVDVVIKPAPVPLAFDTTICYGQSLTLNATGGANYTWTPPTYLSSAVIPNPVVMKPASTITYTLSAVGANGCASLRPGKATVTVQYRLQLMITSDTVALENEPLQLNAIDRANNSPISWLWTPASGLSNPTIQNPVFTSASDMSYLLTAVTPNGCEARDSVRIKVYKLAEIYVPSAFSPNGDGKNDVLKAMPVGIRQFKRFAVYNRWGQMVFSTTDASKGWDGKIAGVPQGNGAFVWMASGVDFKGRLIERKGTTVLIR